MSVVGDECVVCGWPGLLRSSSSGLALRDVEADDRSRYFLGAAVLIAALLNFYTPVYIFHVVSSAGMPKTLPVCIGAFLCGAMAAQVGLLAAWAVLGPQPFALRLVRSNLVFVGLAGAMFIGGAVVAPAHDRLRLLTLFMMSPLVFAAAQAPLWLTRLRTRRSTNGECESSGSQFRLLDLFVAMAAVAIALTIARIGIALETPAAIAIASSTAWKNMMVVCAIAAAVCAVSTLPSVRAALWASNPVAACATLAAIAIGGTIAAGAMLGATLQFPALVTVYLPTSAVAGLFVVQLALLAAARTLGCPLFGARAAAAARSH